MPRAAVLTAATRALLVTRTGEAGGVDVITTDPTGGSDVHSLALPHAVFAAHGSARGTFFVLTADPAGGALVTLGLEAGRLRILASTPTQGMEPCHLAALDERTLVVTNYTSGSLALFDVDDAGMPQASALLPLSGSGQDPERQTSAHPHFAWIDTSSRAARALILDLGADCIRELHRDADGCWRLAEFAELRPGAGPRHAVETGGALVVVDELSGEITAFPLAAGVQRGTIPSSALPGDGPVYPGDIIGIPGGVAVANRARHSVAIIDVPEGGAPAWRAEFRTGGEWPHQLGWDGEHVIVLEQAAGRIIRLDPVSGEVGVVVDGLSVPTWAIDIHEESHE